MAATPALRAAISATGKKVIADQPGVAGNGSEWRRWLTRLGFYRGIPSSRVILEGASEASEATSVPLSVGGGASLSVGGLGVPVSSAVVATSVSVSFVAGAIPPGDWTLTIYKSEGGGAYSSAATFTITH